ncbi:hypothetical protein AVEN_66355-1 [Araneus ventricosus]|uniref:Uncharacterized protein n=1 Tax=Araneus ventricosus TaxID=182803 RepID=A0A4Y2P9C6_ARAVE|nr:hypothetical protein AVEN_66355-1 [Araneus ventricosus]
MHYTGSRVTHALPTDRGQLKNDRFNSSDAELGVSPAPSRPFLKEIRIVIGEGKLNPHYYCTHIQAQELAYLSGGFSSIYPWCPQVGVYALCRAILKSWDKDSAGRSGI